MPHLSLSLLGSPEFRLDGRLITDFHSDKVRALLIYLAVEAERAHRRESLAGLLWPDWPDASARRNMTNALYELRRSIRDQEAHPPFLHVSRDTVQFNSASGHTLDVATFSAWVEGTEEQSQHWEKALDLYRGPFLEGFSLADSAVFEDWALIQRERLARQATEALRGLVAHWEGHGELERACEVAWRHVELEPWREEAHRGLMRLLALTGQRSAALAQYEACRRALAEELDVKPGEETRSLYEQIRDGKLQERGKMGGREPEDDHLKLRSLPATIIPLIGREKELAQIREHLADPGCRLLTLVGPGGSGKTRLAVEAAARARALFPDGVHFVSLAPLQSEEAIVPTVARVLGLSFHSDEQPRQQMLHYLSQRNLLLVMDNYEHLLAGVGLVTEILEAAHQVKVLVTSRASLGLRGDRQFAVGPLGLPEPGTGAADGWEVIATTGHGAVHLFLNAAQRARGDFQLTAENLPHVAKVCRLVQGMPLGILLAAAWVKLLDPAEIAVEIARSLDFLETDWRDVPERQRSMRAVFDHTWRLLSGRERAAFAGLSVLRGSFTRQAAHQVAGATLRDLMGLVDKSLLDRTSEGRYELHELLREYAAERLLETPDADKRMRERHAAYYASAVEQWISDMKGPRRRTVVNEWKEEIDNVWSAWAWWVRRAQVDTLDRTMEGLAWLCTAESRAGEAETAFRLATQMLERAATGATDSVGCEPGPNVTDSTAAERLRVWAKALALQGRLVFTPGGSEPLARRSLALLDAPELADQDTRRERAIVFLNLASEAHRHGNLEEAIRQMTQCLSLYQDLGDRWSMANIMAALGSLMMNGGDYEEAGHWLEQSLAVGRSIGDPYRVQGSLYWLSNLAARQGRFDDAERLLRERSDTVPRWSDHSYSSDALSGLVLAMCGRFTEAVSPTEQDLAAHSALSSASWVAHSSMVLGFTQLHLGQYKAARTFIQASLDFEGGLAYRLRLGESLRIMGLTALAQGTCLRAAESLAESAATLRKGRHPDQLSQTQACLAYLLRESGQYEEAHQHVREALHTAVDIGAFFPLIYALPAFALLLVDRGETERAIELYAVASQSPFVANSRWFEDVAGSYIAAAAESLPPEVVAAAKDRGRARDLWETAKELLAELEIWGSDPGIFL